MCRQVDEREFIDKEIMEKGKERERVKTRRGKE